MKLLENNTKIAQVESRLTKYTYLSKCNLPGYPDGLLFQILTSSKRKGCPILEYPDRKTNPNFYHWYILMHQFAPSTLCKWIEDRLYEDLDDTLIPKLTELQTAPVTTVPLRASDSNNRPNERCSRQKNNKTSAGTQIGYVIDILLKDDSDKMIEVLKQCLNSYGQKVSSQRLKTTVQREGRKVKIFYRGQMGRYKQLIDVVSKSIEFDNMLVKRENNLKTSRA